MTLRELYDYHVWLVNYTDGGRTGECQDALERSARILLEKQERLRARGIPERQAQPGYVYLIECGGVYKIGKSKDAPKRLRSFSPKPPFPPQLIHVMPTNDMIWAEHEWHKMFKSRRLNGEWFALTPRDVALIQKFPKFNRRENE